MTAVPAPGRGRRLVASALGVVVSLALLAWAFRGMRPGDVLTNIRSAQPLLLAGAVVVATSCFVIRAARWSLLLRRDDGGPIRFAALWHATAIGFMANNVLPLRAGEVLRSYAVSRLGGTRFTAAASSIAVERIFDGLAVVFLLALALFAPGLSPGVTVGGVSVSHATTIAGVLSVVALAAAGAVVAWPRAAERVVRALVPARGLADRIVTIIEGVRHGLGVLRSPARFAAVLLWSMVHWLVNAVSFWLAFRAFGLPVNLAGAVLVQGMLIFGIAVPSTPSAAGVFEAVIVAGLALYGVDNVLAASCALVYHVTTFVPIVLLGLWSLARTGIHLGDVRRTAEER